MQASGPEEADPAAVQTAVAIGPADPPQEPMALAADVLEQATRDYDQASGGKWEEHRSALQQRGDAQAWSARYPLAWALAKLAASDNLRAQ